VADVIFGRFPILTLVLGGAVCGYAADEKLRSDPAAVQFQMKKRPSLEVGNWLKMEFRTKVQTDFRAFSAGADSDEGFFDPRRMRVGVEGRLFRDLEYEVEYDLAPSRQQLRDGFINYRHIRRFQFQAGKFKLPFSRDQSTGSTNLDFVYRSRIGAQLAPARSAGAMLHGSLLEKGLRYQAGVFRNDTENSETSLDVPTGGRTAAARITAIPGNFVALPEVLRSLEFGLAATQGQISEGQSLRGRSASGETFFDRLNVNGARVRQGADVSWKIGSLALAGEYINVREQRRGQSLLGSDLPDLFARGWYASAVHPLLGKRKDSSRPGLGELVPGRRLGLVEGAVRYEQIRFGSGPSPSLPSRSPRASNVFRNSDRVLTMGVNWYTSRYTRIQFNAIRETFEDPVRTPVLGAQRSWMFVARFQFVM
jgi:phosphate-selective porin